MKDFTISVKRIFAVFLVGLFVLGCTDPLVAYGAITYTQGTQWEKYGNYYFYNQMSNVEREFYDALNAKCLEFMLGDEDAIDYDYKGTKYHLVGYVGSDTLTVPQMVQIARIFRYNSPQYYFLSTMIFPKSSDNTVSFTTYSKFAKAEDRKEINYYVENAIKKCQNTTNFARSDYDRIKAIHDYIIDMAEYETSVLNEDLTYTQSIYSVFLSEKKRTVCSGYSQAFMMMCNANGIDCICVTSALHQWNKVRIDDVWYNVDLTWDDLGNDEYGNSRRRYTYFCRSNRAVSDLDDSDYHTVEDYWTDFLLPECTFDSRSSEDAPGALYDPQSSTISPGYTSKATGLSSKPYEVSLYTATNGADIYYTTDGRNPEVGSTKSRLYTKPFKVANNTLIRAIAVRDGYKDSSILKVSINEATSGGTSVRLSDCTVKLNRTKFKYTGEPIEPKIKSVTLGDKTLTEGVDYVIFGYTNNTDVGTAKLILSAAPGSNYNGTKTISFSISPYILAAPVVSVKNTYSGIRLSWTAIEGAKGYIIERKPAGGSYKRIKKIKSKNITAFNDNKVETGKNYYYRVTGYSAGNEFRKTYCKSILTCRLPGTRLSALSSEKADSMKVSWERDDEASGYQVKYITGKVGRMFNVDSKYISATVTGLDSGKVYHVYVRSYKNVSDKVIYAKWSPSKKIRVGTASAQKGAIKSASCTMDGYTPEIIEVPGLSDLVSGAGISSMKKGAYSDFDWSQYGSRYYLNQLSYNERKYYNALNKQCKQLLDSGDDLASKINYNGKDYYFLPPISFADLGLSEKKATKVLMLFKFSNPQYFFLNGVTLSDNMDDPSAYAMSIYGDFAPGTAREQAKEEILNTVYSWDDGILAAADDGERVKMIHDLIIKRVVYNTPLYESGYANDEKEYSQSMYSALGWSGKKTVCAGYSLAFMFLCKRYGIDAVCLTSSEHQWNAVRVNDQWYEIDLTWDDDPYQDGSIPVIYSCFCRSSKKMDAIDEAGNVENHIQESYYNGIAPKCIYDSGATAFDPGTFYEPDARVSRPALTLSGSKISIRTSSDKSVVYYTLDGSTPSATGAGSKIYTGAFTIEETEVVKAIAMRPGYNDSTVSVISYTLEQPVLKSVTPSGNSLNVKWKKESGLSGHEIALISGGSTRIIKVSGGKKVNKVISDLAANRSYKVKVRSYINHGRVMYYSPWSKAKKVTL